MICHYGETLLCFESATAFLMRDVAKQSFHEPLRDVYIDLGFYGTTTLLSALNTAASPTKNPMMHSDVQALFCDMLDL